MTDYRTSTQARAGASSGSKPICGARTRKGTPCQCRKLLRRGRCKRHGGASTGPKTAEGKARALANLKRGRGFWKA